MQSKTALIEARPFEEAWVEGGKSFPVYVGIRKWNDSGENVTVLSRLAGMSEVTTRFVAAADPEEIRDLHAGGPVGKVKRLHYLLKVFWESEREQLGDYLMLPVAQLDRMGEEIRASEKFAPPVLAVSASDPLFKLLREIRDQLAARSRQLEESRRGGAEGG